MVVAGIEHCNEEFKGLDKEAPGTNSNFIKFSGCHSHSNLSTTFALRLPNNHEKTIKKPRGTICR